MGTGKIILILFLLSLAAYFYLLATVQSRALKSNLKAIREIRDLEKYYDDLRSGKHFVEDDEDIKIMQMNERDYERFIFKLWNTYKHGDIIANARWLEFKTSKRFERQKSPSPSTDNVKYLDLT